MEDSQASKAPSSSCGSLAKRPITSKRSTKQKQQPTRTIGTRHEETEEDPSPHAQPPASTPSIKSDPGRDSTHLTHDEDDLDKELSGDTSEVVSISDEYEVHTTESAGIEPLSSSSAHDTTGVDPFEDDYMSDADLVETSLKKTEDYLRLSASEKRHWESKRAEASFRAGHAKHFECSVHLLGEQQCSTRQEYYASRFSRPVVSCFFGHNKSKWNQIVKSARVFLCRKCYQRLDHKLDPHLASIHLPLCRELVNRLERWRPGCRFNIKLTKAMEEKVIKFNAERDTLTRGEAAARIDAENVDTKAADIKRAAKTPVLFAIKLRSRFAGENKTSNDVHALLDWLEAKLIDGTIKDFPAFEALLELRTLDQKRLEIWSKRRAAAEEASGTSVPRYSRKPQRSTKASDTKLLSVVEQITEREKTPTSGPSKAAAPALLPPARTFKAINAPIASRTNLSTASGSDSSGLGLLCAAADLVGDSASETDPFISSIPPTRSKIMLKFGKGKMPVVTNPVAEASRPLVPKKRKRAATLVRQDSKVDEQPAPVAKKTKRTKTVPKVRAQEQLPAEKVVDAQTIDIGNTDQASTSTKVVEQKIEIKNGATRLASLTFSGMKVIVDFAPAS